MPFDPDPAGAASVVHMADHVAGPLRAGAPRIELAIGSDGRASVEWTARTPVLVVAARAALADETLVVHATLDPDGSARALPPVEMPPWSEAGSFLPLRGLEDGAPGGTPFVVELHAHTIDAAGTTTPVAADRLAARLSLIVVDGNLGRLLYVIGAEKARLRREARVLAASRSLATARDSALDRTGADLGVPRFDTDLVGRLGSLTTVPRREPDGEYRRRLDLYRRFMIPSRRNLAAALERLGPGFSIEEADNEIAVAIRLVENGPAGPRAAFLQFLRDVVLVRPAAPVPPHRYLPSAMRQRDEELRASLRQRFEFAPTADLAPGLAAALGRLGRALAALGRSDRIRVTRAQDDTGGSRYELGLGVDLAPLTEVEWQALVEARRSTDLATIGDLEVRGVLAAATPADAAADPVGRWLLRACGIRTAHRLASGEVYVSHIPTFGLVVDDAAGPPLSFEARFHTAGDTGGHAVLESALFSAAAEWASGGGAPWLRLPLAERPIVFGAIADPPTTAHPILIAASIPIVPADPALVETLERLPAALFEVLRLPRPLGDEIRTGEPAAQLELRALVRAFSGKGIVSVLPLFTASDVYLAVGVIALPRAGTNLADRRSAGFRWYAVPIAGATGHLQPMGSRNRLAVDGAGLNAVVVLGYARRGLTDPYELRVEPPQGVELDPRAYEYLMNLLGHHHAIGVEINTFAIRTSHVDIDGDGTADPLPPSLARTFRAYRRKHRRGNED